MPVYEFCVVKPDGSNGGRVEVCVPADKAPKIGETMPWRGGPDEEPTTLRRMASSPRLVAGFKPFTSLVLPRHDRRADVVDDKGRPVFNNRESLDRYRARVADDPNSTIDIVKDGL